jgi:long-subunit fatty acid transport protein
MLAEDYLTTSFNVGLLWQPSERFSFGAVYQSEFKADMDGDFRLEYTQDFKNVWNATLGPVKGPTKDRDAGTITNWDIYTMRPLKNGPSRHSDASPR